MENPARPDDLSSECDKKKERPLTIEYTDILHAYGAGSEEAEAFKKQHADDSVFQKRAATLDQLSQLKSQ